MAALRHVSLLAVIAVCSGFRTRHSAKSSVMNARYVDNNEQQYQVYWPAPQTSCSAFLFSVGTAMSVSGYSEFAASMVAKGYIFIVVDPQPGSMTKLNKDLLQTAFLVGKEKWSEWTGNACGSIDAWVMGGHSAGGGTAHNVFVDMPNITDGVFSVDPYAGGDMGPNVDLPALYWGNSETTCFVGPSDAGRMAFTKSAPTKRVLAEVDVQWVSFPPQPEFYHCSISNGCGVACFSTRDTPTTYYQDVVNSIGVFLQSLTTDQWGSTLRSNIEKLETTTPLEWYVNEDSF